MVSPGPIDVVYCFVDGSDPRHRHARSAAWEVERRRTSDLINAAGYFEQVGELTYSVRSTLMFMPWVRQIVIVTDGQPAPVDQSLVAEGKVRVVDHKEFIPDRFRPVFSPPIIESFLHHIPDLSEIWIYQNDDFFLGAPVCREDFVTPAGQLVVRTYPSLMRHGLRRACEWRVAPRGFCNPYTFGVSNAARLLRDRLGIRLSAVRTPRHFTQVYRRTTAHRLEACLPDELESFRALHFRSFSQLSFSTLVTTLELTTAGRSGSTSARDLRSSFFDFADVRGPAAMQGMWAKLQASRAHLICLNNIPLSEKQNFERVMAARGLGDPLS
jgi:hypothetical protein